jgi:Eukaryotic protein of unknown function (DUF829)
MILSMPSSLLIRVLGILLAHVYLAIMWVMRQVLGAENVVQRLRVGLNNKQLFSVEATRMYAYSKADRLVWWEDVEEHAKTAEGLGWEVEKVKFEGSAHAGHILEDREKYWDAVKRTWGKTDEPFSPGMKP